MMRLWADFNELDGDQVWTSLSDAETQSGDKMMPGQLVELWDYEGNTCRGSIAKIEGGIVTVRVDRSTWARAPQSATKVESPPPRA